jgi:5-formyltetrahydrofolate cyclo-ligase
VTRSLDKNTLRTRMRTLRRQLAEQTPDAAERAARRLPLSRFSRFRIVAAYWPQGAELDPQPVLDAILGFDPGFATPVLPVAIDKTSPLMFRYWDRQDRLVPDAFGILAPPPSAPELIPNLVIAPLLAFDRKGGRLGQGAGHYDRTLAKLRRERPVFMLGLGFAGQELDDLPVEPHDQRLDAILTETDYIEVR